MEDLPWHGWRSPVCRGRKLVFGAQDKDVRPDMELILLGMPAVAVVPMLVTTLCRLGPALQPSLDHRPTPPMPERLG